MLSVFYSQNLYAACGGTAKTWKGTTWTNNGAWSPAGAVDTSAEDAIIVYVAAKPANPPSAATTTVGCVDVQSGTLGDNNAAGVILDVTGTYFQAPVAGTLSFLNTGTVIKMSGTAAQTFEAVDTVQAVTVTNTTSVTYSNSFRINRAWTLPASGITYVTGTLRLTQAFTIPAGHTFIIQNGATVYADLGVTVNGTIQVDGGAVLNIANGQTLSVPVGGLLKGIGSSGNPARISSYDASSKFIFTVAGTLSANQLVISRASSNATGVSITGTILQLLNTDFRGMSTYALTLGASVTAPTTFSTLGFYNDDGVGSPKNINATAFIGSVITLSNYAGDVGGASFETDTGNKLTWGAGAPTELAVTNNVASGIPTTSMSASVTQQFASFSFALNQTATATNITEVIVTLIGTGSASDLASIKAYRDNATKNCVYNAGTDVQLGSDLVFSGNPAKATITIPSGDVATSSTSTTAACIHIVATTSALPSNGKTIGFSIATSTDITNSQSYAISGTSGTPANSGTTTLIGTPDAVWDGSGAGNWTTTFNWSTVAVPTTTTHCQIISAVKGATVNANPINCANTSFATNGELIWGGSANSFDVYGSLSASSGFIFTTATAGIITMKGTTNQTLSLATAFPGNMVINKTGGAGNNQIDVTGNSTINGTLTCTAGLLNIGNGMTLTVLGNVIIATGCEIHVGAGGTLKLGTGTTMTVNSGGTLHLIGSTSLKATITSNGAANAYNVIVNGTIGARYYTFDHLNTAGVSIEAGATIDATNYLQDGTFTYPVNNTSTLLFLKRQIPGNALTNMNFDLNGSLATGTKNINTTGAAAGTLTITTYSGDLSGPSFETAPTYLLSWTGLANTIAITQETTSPASLTAGLTYTMGKFGFQQDTAGASFANANITTLKVQLTGTGSASDIAAVHLYRDVGCAGASLTEIGTAGTFTGNPATKTFTLSAGELVVLKDPTTTVKVCARVTYDIAAGATDANTAGVQITNATGFVNDQTYLASTSYPVTLGTPGTITVPAATTWNGSVSTAWATAGNWSNGVPTLSMDCTIPVVGTNYPIISTVGPVCRTLDIQGGNLTINVGKTLDIYQDFTHSVGTLTNNGTITIQDSGANNHYLSSTPTIASLNLAANGKVYVNNSNTTITNLGTMSATSILTMANGSKLTLTNGYTLSSGTIRVEGGGILDIPNGKTLTVSGGTFQVAGTNDTFPQNVASKGIVEASAGGTFSFTTTSGTVDLVGFQFNRLDVNGLNIGGTTTVSNLSGGQFTNLSSSYASVKAIQLNTTGTIPATASNIGWTWGNFNSFDPANANTPTSAQSYKLISSTGCGGQSIDFTGWSGDWYETQTSFDVTTKVSAVSCTVTMSASSSAVSLLSFTAVPYNAAVDVRWETNVERDHLGFNIYRTTDGATRFVQVNKELIRNLRTSGSNRGSYRFIDVDVTNSQNYYYYLEDVDINGRTTMHGPVFAAPFAFLDNPPPDGLSENSDTNTATPGQSGTPATIPNPTYQDLGNGIVILSQTSRSLRIEITPPAATLSASAWDNTYQEIAMAGYSKMTAVGKPELPEKDILIEVQHFATTAAVNNATLVTGILGNYRITPSPNYALNGSGILVPSYTPNSATYGSNTFYPSAFYGVETNLITMNDKKFLKLKINPMRYNPFTLDINSASKITLDIGLDGDDWNITPPEVAGNIGPYSVPNTLRVDYERSGLHQIDYSDFINSQVEGPFVNSDMSSWRLYYQNTEIPIEVRSPTGSFSSGDYIRFYAPWTKSLESKKNQLILSPVNLTGTTSSPKRIEVIDANPTGEEVSTVILTTFTKTIEENLTYIDGFSLGDTLDHYVYGRFFNFPGSDTYSVTTTLPEIDVTNEMNVIVKYYVRGELSRELYSVPHHMKLYVAGNEEGDAIFEENERTVLSFEVPASRFVAGNNTMALKVMGTYATLPDYDKVLVDKVEIIYNGKHAGSSGVATFFISDTNRVYSVDRFATNLIYGYDLTVPLVPKKLSNLGIALDDSGVTYAANFLIDDKLDSNSEKHFSFIGANSFYKPTGLSLNPGSEISLKDSSNRADLIIYGDENLITAAEDLIAMRESQGLEVKTVTPADVYSEFSYGVAKSDALRVFISTALTNWSKAPRYLLILGDGTTDPLDHDVLGLPANERAVQERGTLPAPVIPGRFIDFSSDNYFVSSASTHLPRLAVGRIPTNNPDKIKAYIEKIRSYEAGETAPTATLKKITFIADQDTEENFEHFNQMSQNMMSVASGFTNTLYDRTVLGSLASTTTKINSEFNAGPLMISLTGHGAPDRFGDNIFNTTHAGNLANNIYPIVATWNCETAYFYDADKTMKTLGEELIFNANGGAIVFMGSTTQTTPPAQAKLAQNFFTQLSSVTQKPWDGTRLGDILYQAKVGVGSGTYEKDIVNSFSIIGDPSLKLPASLFPSSPYVAPAAAPEAGSQKKGLFGCSAGASDGSDASPWHEGLIEWLLYMGLIVFGVKKVVRRPIRMS